MQEPTPDRPATHRRTLLAAAAAGAGVTVAGVLALGALAGAQDDGPDATTEAPAAVEPELFGGVLGDGADWAAFDECMTAELGDEWGGGIGGLAVEVEEFIPDELEAELDRLLQELDEGGLGGVIEGFRSGELELPGMEEFPIEEFSFDDLDLDELPAFDEEAMARFEAAQNACATQLPEEIQEGMAAFEAFDECLQDQLGESGVPFAGGFAFGTAVHVGSPDGFEMFEFGEGQGTVTITGDGDGVVVETEGDVTSRSAADLEAEWGSFDEAREACEQFLPEMLFGGGGLFGGEGLEGLFEGFEDLLGGIEDTDADGA
mgnify:FL=1